jgi:Uma2 family endonuclease
MTTTSQITTAEQLWVMPRDNERVELVRGELHMMSPGGGKHGVIAMRVGAMLFNFVEQHRLGTVVAAETGFLLTRAPDTVRAPDVGFVRAERVPDPLPVKFWEGAPDLAVEVLSPSDTAEEIDVKVKEFLNAGTVEVIVINPKLRTVEVNRPDGTAVTLGPGDTLTGLQSVPGFECAVDAVFRR